MRGIFFFFFSNSGDSWQAFLFFLSLEDLKKYFADEFEHKTLQRLSKYSERPKVMQTTHSSVPCKEEFR